MRAILTAVGVIVGLGLTAISATLSFIFCHSLGGTPVESLAYGSAAAGFDILKALAPFYAAWHWRNRQWVGVGAALLLWVVGVTVSVTSAMGLAAQNRLGKSADHTARQAHYRDTQEQLREAQKKLTSLPAARPAQEAEATLQAALTKPITIGKRVRTIAAHTDACSRPDRLTADACTDIGTLRTELARATERTKLDQQISALRERIETLRSSGAGEGSDADRQASIIASTIHAVTGMAATIPAVQTALIALIAIAIEVGATCALYAALGSHGTIIRIPKVQRPTEPTPPTRSATASDYCDARLTHQEGTRLSMRQIHQDYEHWCREQGLTPMERGEFMRALRQEGQGRGWSIAGGVIHHVEFARACRQDDGAQG